jgi:hypothetical protein
MERVKSLASVLTLTQVSCLWPRYAPVRCAPRSFKFTKQRFPLLSISVAVPDLKDEDPYVFGPPGSGSGSVSQSYKSDHQAKIVSKTLSPTFGDLFMTFYL